MSVESVMRMAGEAVSGLTNRLRDMRNDARDVVGEWLGGIERFGWLTPERRKALTGRKGIYHRVVWALPQDALEKGWATHDGDNADVTATFDDDFNVEWALLEARAAARQDGGAWLWPVTDDDDWSEPIGEGPHAIRALHVLCEDEVTPVGFELDPREPRWAQPRVVQITAQRNGVSWQSKSHVHTSRLIYVPGAPSTPSQATAKNGYDLSVLELYRDALGDYEAGASRIARLLDRLSMPWINMKSGKAAAAAEGAVGNNYAARLEMLKTGMDSAGLLVLLGEDTAGWAGPSLAGARDAINVLAERVSAVEGIPLSVLLGQPPGGLSTDDQAGKRAYDAVKGRERRTILQPVLLELYDFALGPSRRTVIWPSLDTPTAIEDAQISEARARRDAVLVQSGIVSPDEARARFHDGEEEALPVVVEDDASLEGLEGELELPGPVEGAEVEQPDEPAEPERGGA